MKKLTTFLLGVIVTITLAAQPPMRPQGQRPLPNQFRDFVDHQQRWNMERPKIEKKDGKVIITMSEEQYKKMQQMRHAQKFRMAQYKPQPMCSECQRHQGKQHRRKI